MTAHTDPAVVLADAALVELSAVFGPPKHARGYPRTETRRIVIRGADGRRRTIAVTVVILPRRASA